jgi:exonuclease SbcC
LNAALRAEQVQSSRAADSATRVGELHSQLVGLLGGAENVGAARRREQRAAQAIDLLLGSLERAAVADEELRAAESAVSGAVAAAGFANAAEAEAALLPADTLEALQARVDEARSAETAVLAALEEPDVDVDLGAPAAVEACEAVLRAARDGARAALAAAAAARTRATDLAGLAPEFERQVLALEPLRRRASEARQLADLAGGQGANRLRMTLSAYVLAARLEEVAAVASERLRRMTQGRYTLVHTDAGRGGARAGLGLLARDTWTGQDRDTATLSGGETFLASLALALALGDVVTAESGGADIEALFVDEGFGSLDEETLEEVMDTLDNLREGGRMVGLVSHVGELRARIPAQIQVRKGRHGSSVEVRPG